MNWNFLTSEPQLEQLITRSSDKPQVIFKHSTRCGISSMVKNRLEKSNCPDTVDFYFLDLIAHRSLSRKIADLFMVEHESPQVLLIKNGKCVYNESHTGINAAEIIGQSEAA